MNRIVMKTVVLNLLRATDRKQELINDLFSRYKIALSLVVEQKSNEKKIELQKALYDQVKALGVPSMLACQLFRDAIPILKHEGSVDKVTVPYNIPRSGSIVTTKRGNPMVSIRTLKNRIAIPIAQDGAYQRCKRMLTAGWVTSAFRLGTRRIFLTLKHYYNATILRKSYDTVLGVDIGSRALAAVSIIDNSGQIVRQLYLGRDIWNGQRDISLRRGRLFGWKALGSRRAFKALKRLRRQETHFTKTRSEQIAHEVERLGKEYNSFIAMENLGGLNYARGGRKSNRKSKRMPYGRFGAALWSVASQNNRLVVYVNPRGTSRGCNKCGARGIRGKTLFTCIACGYNGNPDRNASANVALRAALRNPSWGQISERGVGVMPPVLAGGRS